MRSQLHVSVDHDVIFLTLKRYEEYLGELEIGETPNFYSPRKIMEYLVENLSEDSLAQVPKEGIFYLPSLQRTTSRLSRKIIVDFLSGNFTPTENSEFEEPEDQEDARFRATLAALQRRSKELAHLLLCIARSYRRAYFSLATLSRFSEALIRRTQRARKSKSFIDVLRDSLNGGSTLTAPPAAV